MLFTDSMLFETFQFWVESDLIKCTLAGRDDEDQHARSIVKKLQQPEKYKQTRFERRPFVGKE